MAKNNKQITGDLAKEYCKKFPTSATKEIARALITDHPEAFRDIEHARSMVRYYRGALGDKNRAGLKTPIPKVDIPKADTQADWKPYKITKFPVAVCGDMHMPYHDEEAVGLFIDHCEDINPATIVLAGDCLDCYQLSKFGKNPKFRDFPAEVAMMKNFLRSLHESFPKAKIVYKVGNHEERYERYLQDHAPALFGLDEITLQNLIGATEPWIDYVDNKRVMTAKKLNIIHGHEYVFAISNPVNPARGLYTRAKKNAMTFHFHQTSEHSETAINGDLATCWSVGCLCYSEDTEILTQDGFKYFKDTSLDDMIGTYDIEKDIISLTKPLAKQVYDYDGEMINIHGSRIDALITPDHKMLYNGHNGKRRIKPAGEISNTTSGYNFKVSAKFEGNDYDVLWAKLCGWIVTEGTYDQGKRGKPRLSIYQKKEKTLIDIYNIIDALGLKYFVYIDNRSGCSRIRFSSKSSADIINKIWGGRYEKRIPRDILNADYNILKQLADTLVDADGHENKKGSRYIATIDDGLANDYQEVFLKIGSSAKRFTVTRDTNKKLNSTVHLVRERKTTMATCQHIDKVKYSGKVYDFTSETGWLVVRRNGLVYIASNCDLHPQYMPLNKWNHGFADIFEDGDGFIVHNYRIFNGKIL